MIGSLQHICTYIKKHCYDWHIDHSCQYHRTFEELYITNLPSEIWIHKKAHCFSQSLAVVYVVIAIKIQHKGSISKNCWHTYLLKSLYRLKWFKITDVSYTGKILLSMVSNTIPYQLAPAKNLVPCVNRYDMDAGTCLVDAGNLQRSCGASHTRPREASQPRSTSHSLPWGPTVVDGLAGTDSLVWYDIDVGIGFTGAGDLARSLTVAGRLTQPPARPRNRLSPRGCGWPCARPRDYGASRTRPRGLAPQRFFFFIFFK